MDLIDQYYYGEQLVHLQQTLLQRGMALKRMRKEIWYAEPKIFVIITIVPYLLK